ncbi:hypothetical protein HaLaN_26478, partial [Haematococcus lacustris]
MRVGWQGACGAAGTHREPPQEPGGRGAGHPRARGALSRAGTAVQLPTEDPVHGGHGAAHAAGCEGPQLCG